MYRFVSAAAVGVLLASHATAGYGQGEAPRSPSSQEQKRRKLLENLGLEKKETPPPQVVPPAPKADAPPTDVVPSEGPAKVERSRAPAAPSFRRTIHPMLLQACKACHFPGAAAGATRFILSADAAADHAAALKMVDRANPAGSPLLLKAAGQMHGGGGPWPADSAASARVLAWLKAGARLDPTEKAAAEPAPAAPDPAPQPSTARQRPAPPPPEPPPPAPSPPEPSPPEPSPVAVAPAAPVGPNIHHSLMESCAACHRAGAPAGATRFVLSGDEPADLAGARALVDRASPERSVLVTKAAGETHAGGAPFSIGSPRYQQLLAWARAEATPTASAPSPPVAPTPSTGARPAAAAPPATAAATGEPAASPAGYHGHGGGLALPFWLALNGRFSLDGERRQFSGAPWSSGAVNTLRSYHHFLFLSRESPGDRFGFSVEMLNLLFWEAHVRLGPRDRAWQVVLAGGKILVPFGADPLFHQSYGGLAGFDQQILPVFWAQEGLAAHFVAHRRELVVTDDLYVIRGYALRRGDAVLNLQGDFSPDDAAKLAWGNRIGVAWGPLSAWYSSYFNPLGFGRRLFMQAADVTLWRVRGVPVLGNLSFAAGLFRADVSGGEAEGFGGPGKDYYQFGSYFQLRVHPCDWFYVQYRQGVRTFDNRRGVFVDDTRLTSDDGSTHNFGAVARYRGLTGGLFYFINLEKGIEIPDDFVRASLTYEF
jgi:hypothetical protein